MRIYVASSWRNLKQPEVVQALKADGHDVYDFRHPEPGNQGFHWNECATKDQLLNPNKFRDEVLKHKLAKQGFKYDMDALDRADIVVLVLPCGRSAHLELGYAVGAKKRTVVLLDDPLSEPELMYLMVDFLCTSVDEVRYIIYR